MASRRITSSRPCRCLRCRQGKWGSRRIPLSHRRTVVHVQSAESYQREMDAVRKELEVLIADTTLSDLNNKHYDLWDVIEFDNYEAIQMLEDVKAREQASNALHETIQQNEGSIQLEVLQNLELQESVATLNDQIAQLTTRFPQDKQAALQRCRQSVEEKYQWQIDNMQNRLTATQLAINNKRELQAQVVNSRSERERQLESEYKARVQIKLEGIIESMQKEKAEWIIFKRSEMENEQTEFKNSLRQKIESELKENSQRGMGIQISEARLACIEEQKSNRQAKIEQILAEANKLWQDEHERDSKQLTRNRQFDESESFCKGELS